jgi:NAD(P)-dependent dehydrogenase (short-subunit alcohol dehydrogenase family)
MKSNNTALITGSDRGIGQATAYEFARAGFALIITYYENEDGAQETCKKCLSLGASGVSAFQIDIGNNDSIEKTAKQILQEVDYIDILINNAGVLINKPVDEMSDSDIDRQLGVNLAGSIKLTARLLPQIKRAVVNIGSALGLRGKRGLAVYSASKFGLRGFSQSLADERRDLFVCAVHPGLTDTRMGNAHGMAREEVARVIYQAACGKINKPSGADIDVKFYAQIAAGRIIFQLKRLVKKILGR